MSLKTKLVDFIKIHGKVHWRTLEAFCAKNEYRWADNGSKRMREVRQKGHPNYDPHIGVIPYPDTDAIEYYTYGSSSTVEQRAYKPSVDGSIPSSHTNCCYSFSKFRTHGSECKSVEPVKTGQGVLL